MVGQRENFRKFTTDDIFEQLIKYNTVPEFLDAICEKYQVKPAVISADKTTSFIQLKQDSLVVCSFLKSNNINHGDNLGILIQNNYQFVKNVLGAMAYGAVPVLLPSQLDDKTIYGCSLKYQLKGIIYDAVLENQVKFLKQTRPELLIKATDEVIAQETGNWSNNLTSDSPACIILTSGTSGRSKGALLTHGNLLQGALNGMYGFKDGGFNQVYYLLIPLTHVFGLIRNLLTSLLTGSTIHLCTNMKMMFKELPIVKPTILVIVPALAELLLNIISKMGLSAISENLKTIICGAAPVPSYLAKEYSKYGVTLYPGYGLTESANLVSGNPEGIKKANSVGIILPDQEVKIVNGEIWLKGENIISAYYNEPEENQTAFVDGWFKTGDLGYFDDDGYLYISGRIKDIIVLANGENVSPSEIEVKLNELSFIQDSLIYDEENQFGNQILIAEVFLREMVIRQMKIDNIQKFIEEAVEQLNKSLLSYQRISKVIIRETDFSRSSSMKIIRPKRVKQDVN